MIRANPAETYSDIFYFISNKLVFIHHILSHSSVTCNLRDAAGHAWVCVTHTWRDP